MEGLAPASVQQNLDRLGSGPYQVLVLVAIGVATMAETIELGAVAPLNSALVRDLQLSNNVRDLLPTVSFSGAAFGLVLAAPLGEYFGRRGVLLLSLVCLLTSMLVTSVLTDATDASLILAIRFASGVAGGLQIPAGHALAVESCDQQTRGQLMFGVVFFATCGYLLEAAGMKSYMPGFGLSSTDDWRSFCRFISVFSGLALLPLMLLVESPCFLAVKGETSRCIVALNYIAAVNGRPQFPPTTVHVPDPCKKPSVLSLSMLWPKELMVAMCAQWKLLCILSLMEGGKTFFISGTSYLMMDLFQRVRSGGAMTPAMLNIVCGLAPFVGLAIGERLIWLGVRPIILGFAMLASISLNLLAHEGIRSNPLSLALLLVAAQVAFGPLNTCISLMKLEAFATEVRVHAFAVIGTLAKILCIMAPTIVELLKEDNSAEGWNSSSLSTYIYCLMMSVGICGLLVLFVPGTIGDGIPLEDFVDNDSEKRLSSNINDTYGATHDIGVSSDHEAQHLQERGEYRR